MLKVSMMVIVDFFFQDTQQAPREGSFKVLPQGAYSSGTVCLRLG
jgi:hypothetical protein